MSKDKCALPSCEVELTHTKGRKKKKYCCNGHSVRHWQILHPKHEKKTKQVPLSEWEEIQKTLNTYKDGEKSIIGDGKLPIPKDYTQNKALQSKNTPKQDNVPQEENKGQEGVKECVKEQNLGNDAPPVRQDGENALDFAQRKNEWKIKNSKK